MTTIGPVFVGTNGTPLIPEDSAHTAGASGRAPSVLAATSGLVMTSGMSGDAIKTSTPDQGGKKRPRRA